MRWISALLSRADDFAAHSTWRDFALVKFCLCALGLLIGLSLPRRARKLSGLLAGLVFAGTWLALMGRFLPWLLREDQEL